MSREILARFNDVTVLALRLRGDEWPRGLLGATNIPDAWMGLLEKRDGRRRLVAAGDDPRPEAGDRLLLIRNRPITVPVEVRDAPARCGTPVSASCELLLRWAARDDDLAAASRTLPADPAIRLSDLADLVVQAGAATALQRFIRLHDAAGLVRDDPRAEWLEAARDALKRFCFEIGATVEGLGALKFDSTALAARESIARDAQTHVHRIQAREMIEQAALSATQKRLDQLSGLMGKLRSAAAGDASQQWHDLLPALNPAERATLLENLWRITPDQRATAAIAIVAGSEVAFLDPSAAYGVRRRFALPEDLGGLRSCVFDAARNWLLVGAAKGIWVLSAEDGAVLRRFVAESAEPPRTGFNTALVVADSLYATHSGLGLWRWPLTASDGAGHTGGVALLAPHGGVPRTVRGLAAAPDGRVLFAADDCVHFHVPASDAIGVLAAADQSIHCLELIDYTLIVGTADGKLLRMDIRQPEDWWMPYRAGEPIESVRARRWNDLVELVVAGGSSGVLGIYDEQGVVTRLMESPVPIRRAWAADDLVVGLSDRRDRLVVMNSASPSRAGREVFIARELGTSVQDACLITRTAARA